MLLKTVGLRQAEEASRQSGATPRFEFLRFLLLGICIVGGGLLLSFFDWKDDLVPAVYVGLTTGIVLAQWFLFPRRGSDLGDFFGVSPTPVRRQPFPSDLADVDASLVLSRIRPVPQEPGTALEGGVDCTASIDILIELLGARADVFSDPRFGPFDEGATDG